MAQQIVNDINNFLDKAQHVGQKLEKSQKLVSMKEEQINNILSNLEENVKNTQNSITYNIEKDKEASKFRQISLENIKSFSSYIVKWKDAIDSFKKGFQFINKYDKNIIVVVFGKVNSGKSSLGNYIMGNEINSIIDSKYKEINASEVEVYDRGKLTKQNKLNELSNNKDNEFGVDSTEATSTIQLFKLGGMAWVDTPGIGSITKENEKLAQEYVKNADLVVYVTSSDAAGTQQDFKELEDLRNRKKPILLVVSKSDTNEEDEDEDGELIECLVPKSDKDRKDVENYLLEEISKKNIGEVLKYSEIITISTVLAEEGVKNKDTNMFYSSNMDKFYGHLSNVMSDNAVEFKENNPKERINTLIKDIINGEAEKFLGINGMRQKFNEIKDDIESKKEELSGLSKRINQRLVIEMNPLVENYLMNKKSEMEAKGKDKFDNKSISKDISLMVEKKFAEILVGEINNIISGFNREINGAFNFNFDISLKKKYDTITYEEVAVTRCERDPHGLSENIGSFFGKSYYSTTRTTTTKRKDIEIGTNYQEVFDYIISSMNSTFNDIVKSQISSISKEYFEVIENVVNDMINKIEESEEKLKSIMY